MADWLKAIFPCFNSSNSELDQHDLNLKNSDDSKNTYNINQKIFYCCNRPFNSDDKTNLIVKNNNDSNVPEIIIGNVENSKVNLSKQKLKESQKTYEEGQIPNIYQESSALEKEKEKEFLIEIDKLKEKILILESEKNKIIEDNKKKEEEEKKKKILEEIKKNEQEQMIKIEYSEKEKKHLEEKNKLINNMNLLNNRIKQLEDDNKKINDLNLKNITTINQIKNQNRDLNDKIMKKNEEINILKNEIINLRKKIDEITKSKEPILIGLNNIGATCYMNATLQCLSNTKQLTDYFLKAYKVKPNNIMTNEYHELIVNLWNKEKNNLPYSPYSFKEVLSKENPLFAGIAANDSKDLINFLLERFHKELNMVNSNNNEINNKEYDQTNEQAMLNSFLQEFKDNFNSPISNLFYGLLETKSQCHGCQTIKYNFQVYSFIEFPLQEVNKFCFNMNKRPLVNNDGSNPDVDLYECFDYYGKIDLMNGDNQMYCNICKKLNDAFYSTSIYSSPNNFIINLNRGRGAVYECKVIFPELLNIFNYVTYKHGNTVFELYAVICHLGPSSMSGHFVAYCKNRLDNKWYLYNDGMVKKCIKPYEYRDGMPYILFYRTLEIP